MSRENDMLEVARSAAALARKAGAQEAAAQAGRSREVSVDWRDGQVEKLSDATTRGLSLELYVDGRYAAVSTKDLRPEALQRFVEDSVALTRTLEADPFRSLPDPALSAGQAAVDLQLDDPALAGITAVRRRELAQAAEAAARQVKGAGAILSVTTGFSDTLAESWRVHTNGFEGTRRATSFSVSGEVSVKDADGRRPEDWDGATTRHLASLPAAEAVGRRAAERALGRLGAKKGTSASMTLVIDPRAAGTLVSHLLRPLSGMALQQRQSCLDGKVGVAIGGPLLDLADDPLLPRGLGSRLFDGEGLAARRFPVFEKGVLRSFYVDSYYGKKLKLAPTTRGASNLAWGLGDKDRDALAAAVGEGLLVTGFLGGNSNSTTGDFSLGLNGYRISGGKAGEPVSEMNVSGNHLELWKRLAAVGNDPYPYSPLRTPTLVLEGVAVAGV
jgi:PmbA protein